MNTKNLQKLLEEYKKIDLDLAILTKQKELVKTKVAGELKEEGLDSLQIDDFSVSVSKFDKVMYLKAKLQEFVPPEVLKKCSKTISVETTRISYKK
jgi:hypothetical protein